MSGLSSTLPCLLHTLKYYARKLLKRMVAMARTKNLVADAALKTCKVIDSKNGWKDKTDIISRLQCMFIVRWGFLEFLRRTALTFRMGDAPPEIITSFLIPDSDSAHTNDWPMLCRVEEFSSGGGYGTMTGQRSNQLNYVPLVGILDPAVFSYCRLDNRQ